MHAKPLPHIRCPLCPIRSFALYGGLTEEQLVWSERYRSAQYQLTAKNYLFRQGTLPGKVFTLFSGWVMLHRVLSGGRRQVIAIKLPGDLLGTQPDMFAPMLVSAQALSSVTVCAFKRREFQDMVQQQPALQERLLYFARQELAQCESRLTALGRKDALGRVASFLLDIHARIQRYGPIRDGQGINFPLTQEIIGDALGLTLVHVNRTLRRLRELGLVEINAHRLVIHNIQQLTELAESPN